MTFFFWHFFSDWIFFWKFWTTKISMRSKVIKFLGTYGDPGRPRCMAGFKPCATLVGWKLIWNHVQRTICPHFLARFLWCRFEMGHFMARFLSRPIKAFFLASWNIFFKLIQLFLKVREASSEVVRIILGKNRTGKLTGCSWFARIRRGADMHAPSSSGSVARGS